MRKIGDRDRDKDKDKYKSKSKDFSFKFRKRFCKYCKEKGTKIDYKDVRALSSFITERGKIIPRRVSGTCAKHQREVTNAIKRARVLALIPFTAVHQVTPTSR